MRQRKSDKSTVETFMFCFRPSFEQAFAFLYLSYFGKLRIFSTKEQNLVSKAPPPIKPDLLKLPPKLRSDGIYFAQQRW